MAGLFKPVPYISGINADEGAVTLLAERIKLYRNPAQQFSPASLALLFYLDADTQPEELRQVKGTKDCTGGREE